MITSVLLGLVGLVWGQMLTSTIAQDCVNDEIRTVPSGDDNDYIQYCVRGEWRLHCTGEIVWRMQESNVACRQLGYSGFMGVGGPRANNPAMGMGGPRADNPGEALTTKFFRFPDKCDGTENTVRECGGDVRELDSCNITIGQYGIAVCAPAACTNGEIRLVGGFTNRTGRVEVCMDGRWGTVCNNNQEGLAGDVCAQMGFPAEGATFDTFHPSTPPRFTCTGTVPLQCANGSCNLSPSLGVVCKSDREATEILRNETLSCRIEQNQIITESTETISKLNETLQQHIVRSNTLGAVIGLLVVVLMVGAVGWIVTCVKLSKSSVPRSKNTARVHKNESYSLQQAVYDEATPTQDNYSSLGPNYNVLNYNQQAPPTVQPEPAHLTPAGANKEDDEFYDVEEHTYAMVNKKKAKKKEKEATEDPTVYENAIPGESSWRVQEGEEGQ